MSERREFVALAQRPEANRRALCRQFGISPPTGYKWLARAQEAEWDGCARSRRPQTCPHQTDPAMEAAVLAARQAHPRWGGRKLHAWLQRQGGPTPPRPSTITAILRRHALLGAATPVGRPWQRFVAAAPNDLWQLDFKGHLPLRPGQGRLHPLTVLDDHSRFLVGLRACPNERDATVRAVLTACFQHYGLPWAILTDNGPPWGNSHPTQPLTALSFWLIRLGIAVWHGRPAHPQTQGKVERLHRTLQTELLGTTRVPDLATAQHHFDAWRSQYNQERPHEALALAVPLERYTPSVRPFPAQLPPLAYEPEDWVRGVHGGGQITVQGQEIFLTTALTGERVALRPTPTDGIWQVRYAHHQLGILDLTGEHRQWHVRRTDGREV